MTIGGTAVGSVVFGSRAGGRPGTRDLQTTKSSNQPHVRYELRVDVTNYLERFAWAALTNALEARSLRIVLTSDYGVLSCLVLCK